MTERSFGQFPMVRYGEPALRWMSEDDVATRLMIDDVAHLLESSDGVSTRANGQTAHVSTSTSSSVIGRGTASPCFSKLAR